MLLLWKAPRLTLLGFAAGRAVVAVAFFGTNWIAHHSLKPAYMHRSGDDNWYDYTYERNGRTIESYWKNPAGVDRGEPSREVYAFNVLVGHHGIFSLTPVWLLSVAGHGRLDVPARRSAAALVGGGDGRHLAGLPGVLSGPAADEPQLRRHHQRPALDVLARAALAADDAAGGRRPGLAALDPRPGPGVAGPLGPLGQLSDVESLDASLADELVAVSWTGEHSDRARR